MNVRYLALGGLQELTMCRRPTSALGHVWTAPWQELSDVLVGCGHVSGLLMRAVETAGSDGVREQGPILLFRLRRRSEKMAIMTQMATVDQLLRKTLAVLDD